MGRARKQLITNLYIKPRDVKELANGRVVYKFSNKHKYALMPRTRADNKAERAAKEREKKIEYYTNQLKKLGALNDGKSNKYTKRTGRRNQC